MKPCYPLFLLFLFPKLALSQPLISDVRIRMLDAARLEILYNLSSLADSVWVEAETRFGGQLRASPTFLFGDLGHPVQAGSNRRIVWYLYDEGYHIKADIRIRVLARLPPLTGMIAGAIPNAITPAPRSSGKPRRSVGPGWAVRLLRRGGRLNATNKIM